jgi:SAM-dependent methyltransferase/uncharacterized protein YbaR (Trm112 family)
MKLRILDFLRCPDCKEYLRAERFDGSGDEIETGVLHCKGGHLFPVVGGIPRMLPSSFEDNWREISEKIPRPAPPTLGALIEERKLNVTSKAYDTKTKANFSNEWDNHDIGGKTWTMELGDRIKWFFLDPIKIDREDLNGKIMLDAGCGNGSQSVAYTEFGLEVIALDLSTGLEKGYAYRNLRKEARADKVHFVQADLQNPPLAPDSFDIIHSAGVLHHTPNTEKTFRALRPLLKEGGTFYLWLYKYEKVVTPIVNSIRTITTRLPGPTFAQIANATAVPFIGFCWAIDKLGIRRYQTPSFREAKIAVHDIFGAPYAHYHSFEEVSTWFKSVGIDEVWPVNEDRRGFGICGRAVQGTDENSNVAGH